MTSASPHRLTSPACSVIIPTHGRTAYLLDAVRSVQAQSHRDWECWVVSDDPEEARKKETIIRSLKDDRIHFLLGPRPGANASRNEGMRHASGRYLFFLDDDDYWLPDKIALHLDAHKKYAFVSSDSYVRHEGKLNYLLYTGKHRDVRNHRKQLREFRWCPTSMSFDRELAKDIQWDEALTSYQDWDFWFRLFDRDFECISLNQPLAVIRHHANPRASIGFDRRRKNQAILKQKYGNRLPEETFARHLTEEMFLSIRNFARSGRRLFAFQWGLRLYWSHRKRRNLPFSKIVRACVSPNPDVRWQLILQQKINRFRGKPFEIEWI